MTFLLWLLQEESGSSPLNTKQVVDAWKLHLGAKDYLLLTLIISVVTTIVSVVFKVWIEESVKKSFAKELEDYKHVLSKQVEDYKLTLSKQAEDYRLALKLKDQSAKTAEFLARYYCATDSSTPDEQLRNEQLRLLNQSAWELSLWLPADILKCLTDTLSEGQDIKKLLLKLRETLRGCNDPDLKPEDILHIRQATRTMSEGQKESTDA